MGKRDQIGAKIGSNKGLTATVIKTMINYSQNMDDDMSRNKEREYNGKGVTNFRKKKKKEGEKPTIQIDPLLKRKDQLLK